MNSQFFDLRKQAQCLLYEYDQILSGRRKTFSTTVMAKSNGEELISEMLRLIFEGPYFRWTPRDIRDRLTAEVIEKNKLWALVNRIPCPPEISKLGDYCYVAWHLYPETKNATPEDLIRRYYSAIVEERVKKFPPDYFDGEEGLYRALFLFQIMLDEYLDQFDDIASMYRFFDSDEGKKAIKKFHLETPLKALFLSPLEYLHAALPEEYRDYDAYADWADKREAKERRKQNKKKKEKKLPDNDGKAQFFYISDEPDEDASFILYD